MIQGIDVSKWEPVINWIQVKAADYRFAFIKASQGTYADPKFVTHWRNAREAGIDRGAYHFYDPSASPENQARFFLNTLNVDWGELPFVVDIEGFISGPYHGSQNWYRFLVELNKLSNNHPVMIYTGYYYWLENVKKSPAVQDVAYFKKYPLWVANYQTAIPLVPYPWTSWAFWQYSETGIVPGVYDDLGRPTKCDLDRFYGDEQQYQEVLNGNFPSGGSDTVSTFYLAKGNATIRTGPSSSYPNVATGEKYVLTGDIVESLEPQQNGWLRIANIYRNDVKMVVADPAWCTGAYLQITTYTPPGNPPPTTTPTLTHTIQVYSNGSLVIDGKPYV